MQCASPFILNGHMTCCMCTFDDVISDVITLQDDVMLQFIIMTQRTVIHFGRGMFEVHQWHVLVK